MWSLWFGLDWINFFMGIPINYKGSRTVSDLPIRFHFSSFSILVKVTERHYTLISIWSVCLQTFHTKKETSSSITDYEHRLHSFIYLFKFNWFCGFRCGCFIILEWICTHLKFIEYCVVQPLNGSQVNPSHRVFRSNEMKWSDVVPKYYLLYAIWNVHRIE